MSQHSEHARQLVHIAVGGVAFSLRFLTWGQAAACAAIATLFNALVLPRIAGRTLLRPEETKTPWTSGLVVYPLSVLALVLAFPTGPDLAAAAWGILAFGDGTATLVGRSRAGEWGRWPWNPAKSYAGSVAFWLSGALGAGLLMWWTAPALAAPRPWWMWLLAPPAAAMVAALVESLPIRLDDNVSVPIAAALALWCFTLVDAQRVSEAGALILDRAPAAVAVNLAVAAASWRLRAVSTSGVVAGLVVGLVIWLLGGASAWTLLFAAFALATIASRLGLRRKRLLGIEQEREGRRGAGNALANCGVAAVAAALSAVGHSSGAARLALVTALIAGACDTVASEIGKAWGRRTWSPLTLGPVPAGTIGGMSLEGTVAGVCAATALAAFAAALGLVSIGVVWMIVAGASLAMVIEGVIGAMLEPRGILDNDTLNFLDTLVAAATALALWTWFGA